MGLPAHVKGGIACPGRFSVLRGWKGLFSKGFGGMIRLWMDGPIAQLVRAEDS